MVPPRGTRIVVATDRLAGLAQPCERIGERIDMARLNADADTRADRARQHSPAVADRGTSHFRRRAEKVRDERMRADRPLRTATP